MAYCNGAVMAVDFSADITEIKRKINLHGIMHDFPTKVNYARVMDAISKEHIQLLPENCVITGSMALFFYGLLDRNTTDLDVIAPHESVVTFSKINGVRYKTSSYQLSDFEFTDDIEQFQVKNIYDVDFFVREDYTDYIEVHGLKIDLIPNIVEQKAIIGRRKDLEDLRVILERLTEPKKIALEQIINEPIGFFQKGMDKITGLLKHKWKY